LICDIRLRNEDYLMKLIIPKINFDMNLYKVNSKLNDVNYNIEILNDSDLSSNLFFIAGHSGDGDNCYFNRIKELAVGEYVYVVVEDRILVYVIISRYFINKDGYMKVDGVKNNTLFLITCDVFNNNRQLVLKGKLIN